MSGGTRNPAALIILFCFLCSCQFFLSGNPKPIDGRIDPVDEYDLDIEEFDMVDTDMDSAPDDWSDRIDIDMDPTVDDIWFDFDLIDTTDIQDITEEEEPAEPLENVIAISAGGEHTCALLGTGQVKCWGLNSNGQLGNGLNTARYSPVDVVDVAGPTNISAGWNHTCAVTSSGLILQCWGDNLQGQLGIGGRTDSNVPVQPVGLDVGIQAAAADNMHTCALESGGSVKCWGHNVHGEIGDGTTDTRLIPVDTQGLTDATAITVGHAFSCAILFENNAKCWGNNEYGQLGYNSPDDISAVPIDVFNLGTVSSISAFGDHACALTTAGGVKCWGKNDNGQLGNGTFVSARAPVDVTGMISNVEAVDAGLNHTCAVMNWGEVRCWGDDFYGQLGNGEPREDNPTASDVLDLPSLATAVSAGGYHTCALLDTQEVVCWGRNRFGQLGNGTVADYSLAPVYVVAE